ncbi:MAG: class I SAM-dependent DNA methyltransferase [Candidatus Weimeria sp.]
MCDSYTSFAEVYDLFMDNVPYDRWAKEIDTLLKKYLPPAAEKTEASDSGKSAVNAQDKPMVLDLGCGTGQITRRLRDMGYDMTGVDSSDEMLEIARAHEIERTDALPQENESVDASVIQLYDDSILYICQDMRELDLFGTYQGVVSVCDCMNYITDKDDFLKVLRRVNNFLHPGGVFIFDINTEYKYEKVLADNTFAENRDEGSFIWENEYDCDKKLNIYDLTLYIRGQDGRFDRFFEQHLQRSYRKSEIVEMIEAAGLEPVEILDTDTFEEPSPTSEKITFVAREHLKDPDRPGFYKDGSRQTQMTLLNRKGLA